MLNKAITHSDNIKQKDWLAHSHYTHVTHTNWPIHKHSLTHTETNNKAKINFLSIFNVYELSSIIKFYMCNGRKVGVCLLCNLV